MFESCCDVTDVPDLYLFLFACVCSLLVDNFLTCVSVGFYTSHGDAGGILCGPPPFGGNSLSHMIK